jgi:hypothetical protein
VKEVRSASDTAWTLTRERERQRQREVERVERARRERQREVTAEESKRQRHKRERELRNITKRSESLRVGEVNGLQDVLSAIGRVLELVHALVTGSQDLSQILSRLLNHFLSP